MKCFLFFLSTLLFLSNVASLEIFVQNPTTAGAPTLVVWTRQDSDDTNELKFDLRFVQEPDEQDVGIALANIRLPVAQVAGRADIFFPSAGQFVVKAVSGPTFDVIGISNAVASTDTNTITITTSATQVPTATDAATAASATSTTSDGPPTISPTPSPLMTPSAIPAASSPSPTASSPPSDTTQPKETGIVAAVTKHPNLPAIVGGIIGGLIVLGVVAALIIFITRRRATIKKRLTFHRDMMVQSRSNPNLAAALSLPLPSPSISITPPPEEDLEQGLQPPMSAIGRALGSGHIVPSPRGPRPSIRREVTTIIMPKTPVQSAPVKTRRQKELGDRMAMLLRQIAEMEAQPDSVHAGLVVQDMKRQLVWLNEHENCSWALGQTDVLPPGYARHMTP